MGRHGPLPAPAAVKLAKGETRPSRVNYEAPLPRQRLPRMPAGMDAGAQAVWRHIIREMGDAGVLTGADSDMLRVYCEAMAGYAQARAAMNDSGLLIRGTRGRDVIVNPLWRIVQGEREMARLLSRELGLSPAARAALRLDLTGPGGDMDAVLGPPTRLRVVGGLPEED